MWNEGRSKWNCVCVCGWRGETPTDTLFNSPSLSLVRHPPFFLSLTCGSKSLTTDLAFAVSWVMSAACWTVLSWSRVVRMGMPSILTMTIPSTPLCVDKRLMVSSTSDWGTRSKQAGARVGGTERGREGEREGKREGVSDFIHCRSRCYQPSLSLSFSLKSIFMFRINQKTHHFLREGVFFFFSTLLLAVKLPHNFHHFCGYFFHAFNPIIFSHGTGSGIRGKGR